jgi:hypothetical protein
MSAKQEYKKQIEHLTIEVAPLRLENASKGRLINDLFILLNANQTDFAPLYAEFRRLWGEDKIANLHALSLNRLVGPKDDS